MSERALDQEPASSLARQLIERLLPLVGILAALTYSVLWLAYAHFYYYFEVAPEEVGLGQFQVLSQSFVGLIFLLLVLLAIFAILALLLLVGALLLGKIDAWLQLGMKVQALFSRWLVRRPFKTESGENQGLSEAGRADGTKLKGRNTTTSDQKERARSDIGLWFSYGLIAIVLVLGSFATIFQEADRAARGVSEDGYTISAVHYRIGVFRFIILNVKAAHSTVEWKATANIPSALSRNPQCIMYLGKADDTTVLFNVKDSTTIRFPTNDAVIVVHPATTRLPASCYE